jgi:S-adenosylmethionine synthetase
MGVDAKKKGGNLGEQEGAGDQGLMFGFACRDSEEYEKGSFMPAPIYFSHKILEVLSRRAARANCRPAARRQEPGHRALRRRQGGRRHQGGGLDPAPRATAKGKKYNSGMVKEMIAGTVEVAAEGWMPKKAADFFVNPTGNFVVGGPDGDCGLTGRKIIVDTYGGYAPARRRRLLGKDPTKVDRSAAYAARYSPRTWCRGLADRCLIQVAYAIGVADPMSLYVDTAGTGKVDERKLEKVPATSSRCARPTSAAACSSTSRSTSAPPPTAISAASPTAMAVSIVGAAST